VAKPIADAFVYRVKIASKSLASSSLDGPPGHLVTMRHHLAWVDDVHVYVHVDLVGQWRTTALAASCNARASFSERPNPGRPIGERL
jgi:hypothetical protein